MSARSRLLSGDDFHDLGIPKGGTFSRAHALNDAQQVVGRWGNGVKGNPAQSAFVWQDGVMTDLGALLDPEVSHAADINQSGTIVGRVGSGHTANAYLLNDPKVAGDFSCDGLVNAIDLTAIINTWGQTNSPPTDLTQDGTVGPPDLGELLASWAYPSRFRSSCWTPRDGWQLLLKRNQLPCKECE